LKIAHLKGRKVYRIGHIALELPFKSVIEGRIEVTERRGRRHEQLLEDLKEKKGYWKLKEAAV
jgi:hypothetical protein